MSKEILQMISELKKSTLGSYIKKSNAQLGTHRERMAVLSNRADDSYWSALSDKRTKRKTANRERGIDGALNRLTKEDLEVMSEEDISELIENVEQLDELSRQTLATYVAKSASDARIKLASAGYLGNEAKYHKSVGHLETAKKVKQSADAADKKSDKRMSGVIKASMRLAKEDVESITESHKIGDRVIVQTAEGDKPGKVNDITKTHIGVKHPAVKGVIHYHPDYVKRKVDEAVDETLMEGVDWSRWERSHSGSKEVKKSNRGSWMVSKHKDGYRYGHKEGEDHITVNGTGKEAASAGQKWAKEKGHPSVYVLESFMAEEVKSDISLSSIANSALTTARKPY